MAKKSKVGVDLFVLRPMVEVSVIQVVELFLMQIQLSTALSFPLTS